MNSTAHSFKQFVDAHSVLSGSTLKIIACLSMLIDHTGAAILYYGILLPYAPISNGTGLYTVYLIYRSMRVIGRLAFPIFCFLLVQGFLHTSDRRNYGIRLAAFALISEFPFDLALQNQLVETSAQNVYFTLLIGYLVMNLMEKFERKPVPLLLSVAAGMGLSELLQTDYSWHGILLIALLYFFRYYPGVQTLTACLSLLWEAPACLAFIPINLYNQKRGLNLKYVFYWFYPVHLLLLSEIRLIFF